MFNKKLGWIGYLVSNFDIIVVTVDGRGTGYRGERLVVPNYKEYFKKIINNNGSIIIDHLKGS